MLFISLSKAAANFLRPITTSTPALMVAFTVLEADVSFWPFKIMYLHEVLGEAGSTGIPCSTQVTGVVKMVKSIMDLQNTSSMSL